MKKIFVILLAFVMVFALAACGGGESGESEGEGLEFFINSDGMGQIAWAEGEGTPEYGTDETYQSMMINAKPGEVYTLGAMPDEGWVFVKWTKDGEDYSEDFEITVEVGEESVEYCAYFEMEGGVQVVLNLETDGMGEVAYGLDGAEPEFSDENPLNSAQLNFLEPTTVKVNARPAEGWKFVNWTLNGDEISAEAAFEYEATESVVLVANFTTDDSQGIVLRLNTNGLGQIAYAEEGGTPEFDDDFPTQSAQINMVEPAKYVLSAKADEGYKFVKWTKDDEDYSEEETIEIEVTESVEYRAVFETE